MTIAADLTHDQLTEGQREVIAYWQAKVILEGALDDMDAALGWLTDVDDTSLISEVNRARRAVASVMHQIPDRMKP